MTQENAMDNQDTIPLPPVDAPSDLLQRFDLAVASLPFLPRPGLRGEREHEAARRSEALRQFAGEEPEAIKQLRFDRETRRDKDLAEKRLEEEKHNRQERLMEFLSDVGPRLAGATLDNFVVTSDPTFHKAQQAALAAIRRYIANLTENVKTGAGLWLHGTVGTGKDHLLVAIAKTAITDHGMGASKIYNGQTGEIVIPLINRGLRVARITGSALFRGAREAMHRERESRFVDELTSPDILILSDPLAVVGDLTPFQAQTLFEVADTRNAMKRPTWTTLNVVDSAEADRRLGPAIADRLRHDVIDVECRWPSYRTERE